MRTKPCVHTCGWEAPEEALTSPALLCTCHSEQKCYWCWVHLLLTKPWVYKRVSERAMCVFFQKDDDIETLCKATTVVLEGQSCHRQLEGIHLNLLHILQRKSTVHEVRAQHSSPANCSRAMQPSSFLHIQLLPQSPFPLPHPHQLQNQVPLPPTILTVGFFLLQAPCPVATANTTSLTQFLVDLHRLLQRLVKY